MIFSKAGLEICRYSSDTDIRSLKLLMEENFSYAGQLEGKFNNEHAFECWAVGQIAYLNRPGKPQPLVYLTGELIPNGSKTEVVVQLVSYSIWMPMIGSLIIGILCISRFIETGDPILLVVSILLFLTPVFLLYLAKRQKEGLKNKFAHTFKLQGPQAI
jgi:hypothetical protein